jgi:hypothetical protein
MDETVGGLAEMRERIDAAVGRGRAADGLVVAEYRGEGGLTALDLDPRAGRLPLAELAEEIRKAVNEAARDFRDQVRRAAGGVLEIGEDPERGPDPAAALASLDKIANGFAGQLRDLAHELGVQQQHAREAMERYRRLNGPRTSG